MYFQVIIRTYLNRPDLNFGHNWGVFMKKFLKGAEGFTLVELMVVVAIIGILSAVAIPNFKRYQAKSKQSEAKIQLAAVYTAEVSTNSDYDTYGTCLVSMGYDISPRGYYTIGFETGYDASTKFAACTAAGNKLSPGTHQSANGAIATTLPTSTAAQNSFTAGAAGQISTSSTTDDTWTVDNAKAFVNAASL